jgi:hypothetical protein
MQRLLRRIRTYTGFPLAGLNRTEPIFADKVEQIIRPISGITSTGMSIVIWQSYLQLGPI